MEIIISKRLIDQCCVLVQKIEPYRQIEKTMYLCGSKN
jgi:hypothetical protein